MSPRKPNASPPISRDWQVAVYETLAGQRPALEYLGADDVPEQPRRELLMTVLAVAETGPLRFPSGTPRWQLMHKPSKKGQVDMSGIFEARDEHNRVLYRLFCLLDREGLEDGPSVVLLGGGTKPDRTEMPAQIYQMIDSYRDHYRKTRRVARLKAQPAWWPQPHA